MGAARNIRNLTLTGFMGSGKSTVGRMAASLLRFQFLDTDHLIERRAGMRIADMFQQRGEAAFRTLEQEVVAELAVRQEVVIATGGGVVVNPDNLASLKQHSLVVCLWASPETVWNRVRHSSHRPLLKDANPLARIRQLLAERRPFYQQADVLVQTELRTLRDVAGFVVQEFRHARRPSSPP